jgi:hypothetical protein
MKLLQRGQSPTQQGDEGESRIEVSDFWSVCSNRTCGPLCTARPCWFCLCVRASTDRLSLDRVNAPLDVFVALRSRFNKIPDGTAVVLLFGWMFLLAFIVPKTPESNEAMQHGGHGPHEFEELESRPSTPPEWVAPTQIELSSRWFAASPRSAHYRQKPCVLKTVAAMEIPATLADLKPSM